MLPQFKVESAILSKPTFERLRHFLLEVLSTCTSGEYFTNKSSLKMGGDFKCCLTFCQVG
jgi:hypothetical protein